MILTLNDLEASKEYHYLGKVIGDIEVCLEPCLNGYCIAIYDNESKELLRDKVCTNLPEGDRRSALVIAISILNSELNSYLKEKESAGTNTK